MSAETLRRAASLMRERAEAATPGPLEVSHWTERGKTTHHTLCKTETRVVRGEERGGFLVRQVAMTYADRQGHADFEHIASWHPAVALVIADMLDREGKAWQQVIAEHPDLADAAEKQIASSGWLAVARAYLGEGSA